MAPAAKTAKKSGKENAPPSRSKSTKAVADELDTADEVTSSFIDEDGPSKRPLAPSKRPAREDDLANGKATDGRKLSTVLAERDRYREQRDDFAAQFEELSKSRNGTDELFARYKDKAAMQAKAQTDVIASLTAHNDKLQEKVRMLEKALQSAAAAPAPTTLPAAGGVFDGPAASSSKDLEKAKKRLEEKDKEVKVLQGELAKTQAGLKERETKIAGLERDLKAEITHSRSLQASSTRNPLAASVSNTPEEAEKDALSLKLYEDLTDLNITNVKIRTGKGGKEVTFNCVQTIEARSLAFKLRSYNDVDSTLVGKSDNPWVKKLHFTPEGLEYETDQAFKECLGPFAAEFAVPREMANGLYEKMRRAVRMEDDDE